MPKRILSDSSDSENEQLAVEKPATSPTTAEDVKQSSDEDAPLAVVESGEAGTDSDDEPLSKKLNDSGSNLKKARARESKTKQTKRKKVTNVKHNSTGFGVKKRRVEEQPSNTKVNEEDTAPEKELSSSSSSDPLSSSDSELEIETQAQENEKKVEKQSEESQKKKVTVDVNDSSSDTSIAESGGEEASAAKKEKKSKEEKSKEKKSKEKSEKKSKERKHNRDENKNTKKEGGSNKYTVRLTKLKRLARTAGLGWFQYSRDLSKLQNDKAKVQFMENYLKEKGITQFTLEFCKKYCARREREKEIAELNLNDILPSPEKGSTGRRTRSKQVGRRSPAAVVESSPGDSPKLLRRLQAIADSDSE